MLPRDYISFFKFLLFIFPFSPSSSLHLLLYNLIFDLGPCLVFAPTHFHPHLSQRLARFPTRNVPVLSVCCPWRLLSCCFCCFVCFHRICAVLRSNISTRQPQLDSQLDALYFHFRFIPFPLISDRVVSAFSRWRCDFNRPQTPVKPSPFRLFRPSTPSTLAPSTLYNPSTALLLFFLLSCYPRQALTANRRARCTNLHTAYPHCMFWSFDALSRLSLSSVSVSIQQGQQSTLYSLPQNDPLFLFSFALVINTPIQS